MKQLKPTNLIVVEVPEDACDFRMLKTFLKYNYLENGKVITVRDYGFSNSTHKILGKLSELSEEECSRLVEKHPNLYYKDYNVEVDDLYINGWTTNWKYITAKESFISLLQSQGVDTSKNLLLIEKL